MFLSATMTSKYNIWLLYDWVIVSCQVQKSLAQKCEPALCVANWIVRVYWADKVIDFIVTRCCDQASLANLLLKIADRIIWCVFGTSWAGYWIVNSVNTWSKCYCLIRNVMLALMLTTWDFIIQSKCRGFGERHMASGRCPCTCVHK